MTGAGAVARATEVVDHDTGAFAGQGKGVFTAQTTAGTGDDDDSINNSGHEQPFSD
ncbi:hypothetical protein MSAR_17700 [Mycolicibacterium sarraceniae]|uniref:Uncharacterized protein n=1 Tax=Mycolicibacterium sarraceniae TaxID=1534348 RepID=A0A7I7SNQ0_9MYCO|nr:hypothetical protein MSAR_17700 [Mycolicibacterium sarraceniae]